ncbi:unnamed protein product [Symbiodinium sp. CCMP2456]|nr:unnamed protein product [Symbiodinium sp. CCMP2456]
MDEKKPGDRIVVKAIRDNSKTVGMTLVLGSQEVEVPVRPTRPDRPVPYDPLGVEEEMPLPADPLPPPVDNAPRVLGVRVVPLTDQIRAQTGVSVRRGAYVESVSRGSVADRANIPVGAVIVSYDGRRVDDAVGLIQMVRSSPADRTIPVNYYYGNRMESTQLYYGNPRDLPPPNDRDLGPGTPGANGDRPALRMLQNALEAVEGGEMPAGMVSQEQVDSLSRRVRDLEQEVRELREELRAMRNGSTMNDISLIAIASTWSAESFVRLLLATLCGAALGWEREKKAKPAGLRTHMMVSLGAATFVLAGLHYTESLGQNEPSWLEVDLFRIVSGIIGGVGFLGAGSIIESRGDVRGLTTAASIWVAAATGLACGMGFYGLGVMAIGLAMITLVCVGAFERFFFDGKSDPGP